MTKRMRQSYTKLGKALLKSAVALVLVVIWSASSYAQMTKQAPVTNQAPVTEEGAIVSITPATARSGEAVTIDVKANPAFVKGLIGNAYVTFDDISVIPARVIEKADYSGVILEVVVPELKETSSPRIAVHGGNSRTLAYSGFEVAGRLSFDLNSALILAVLAAMIAGVFWLRRPSKMRAAEIVQLPTADSTLTSESLSSQRVSEDTENADAEEYKTVPAPEPPEELITAVADRSCVLVVGGGIAAQAGAPHWYEPLKKLAEGISDDESTKNRTHLAARAQEWEQVADMLIRRLPREEIVKALDESFGTSEIVPEVHKLLAQMPFFAHIDVSWNTTFEAELRKNTPSLESVTFHDESLAKLIRSNQPFLIKLAGELERPETVLITYGELRQMLKDAPEFSRGVSSLASSNRFLFLGVSRESIETVMSSLDIRPDPERPHFALVPDEELMTVYQEQYLHEFGVELLPYQSGDLGQFSGFVEKLAASLSTLNIEWEQDSSRTQIREAYLDRVILKNIGAFSEMDITLNHGWNVLLGNNGCGKSTVLKAIGTALCGDAVKDVKGAQALLRRGEKGEYANTGSVEIRVGKARYRTRLVRDGRGVKLESEQYTPLQTGTWAVLGFPAQRGVTERQLSGASQPGVANPNVDDVLPLITGTVDYRMDDLRQWLLNTVLRSEDPSGDALAKRSQHIREKFFSIIKVLLVNDDVHYAGLDRENWKILVRTNNDVVVPIEDLSQGMNSILGWVGTLVQRIYEIHSDTDEPETRPALVLIDEIDAHLHPAWQMRLIPLLKEHFPKLQVVATTHSPLLAGALDPEHVLIASRDPETRAASIHRSSLDTEGMPADQILTSPLFGLATTRTRGDTIDRYVELLGKEGVRSEEEEEEFESLKERVERLLSFGASEFERKVTVSVTKAVEEQVDDQMSEIRKLSDADKEHLKLRIADFFDDDPEVEAHDKS